MPRVKGGVITKKRHKKIIKAAKGYRGQRHKLYSQAKIAGMKAGRYAFKDRRRKKREFRKLWIARINAACRPLGINYSRLVAGMTMKGILINRKMLAEMAVNDFETFKEVVKKVK